MALFLYNNLIMFYSIFKHYFKQVPAASILMQDFQTITNYDSCYFVAKFQSKTYVVLEIDHLDDPDQYLEQLPEYLQLAGTGWMLRNEFQNAENDKVTEHIDENDFDQVFVHQNGMHYGLILVDK